MKEILHATRVQVLAEDDLEAYSQGIIDANSYASISIEL